MVSSLFLHGQPCTDPDSSAYLSTYLRYTGISNNEIKGQWSTVELRVESAGDFLRTFINPMYLTGLPYSRLNQVLKYTISYHSQIYLLPPSLNWHFMLRAAVGELPISSTGIMTSL